MPSPTFSTISLDPELHQVLCMEAEMTGRSLSDVVNDAVRQVLSADARLEILRKPAGEPILDFEDVVLQLRRLARPAPLS
jgi:hypothetical protein